jgi:hypothetical protein
MLQAFVVLRTSHTVATNKCVRIRSLSFVIVEVTTVGQLQIQYTLFYIAWQQASKHINKLVLVQQLACIGRSV